MYKQSDIKSLSWQEHVIQRSNLYFGTNGPCPKVISANIAEGALILGAESVEIKKVAKFWCICANFDWLNAKNENGVYGAKIFNQFCPFQEAGSNSIRFECMAFLFSKTLILLSKNDVTLIKGTEDDLELFTNTLSQLKYNEVVIAFEFSPEQRNIKKIDC